MMYHLAIQLPNHGSLEPEAADEEGPGGYVDDGAGEGLVEGRVAVAEAGEAGAGAEGGGEGAPEGEEGVFGRVVVVDCRRQELYEAHNGEEQQRTKRRTG